MAAESTTAAGTDMQPAGDGAVNNDGGGGNRLLSGVCIVLFCVAVGFGGWLRFQDLSRRPFHHDEANQAVRFGELLDNGDYEYDKGDHHGPTLYYLTLPSAWLSGKSSFSETTDFTFRVVPVVFGLAVLFVPLLMVKRWGWGGVLTAGALASCSPAMAYYSRYYIQEMLFVFFCAITMAGVWRYTQSKHWGWALMAGLGAGLVHATKETCLIFYAACIAGAVGVALMGRRRGREPLKYLESIPGRHWLILVVSAFAISTIFYASFGRNPIGVWNAFTAYFGYAKQAQNVDHVHPWYYYMKILLYYRVGRAPVWTEAFIVVAAVVSGVWALFSRNVDSDGLCGKFLAFYTLFTVCAFSLIPYKTPWNLLLFLHGMCLLSGWGFGQLMKSRVKLRGVIQTISLLILIAGCMQLAWLAHRTCLRFDIYRGNPYVYSHTTRNYLKMIDRIDAIAALDEAGKDLRIDVISGPYEWWPQPYYLREYPNVGYYPPDYRPTEKLPLLILGQDVVDDEFYEELSKDYRLENYGLRPDVLLFLAIRRDLWDKYMESVTHPAGENL